MGWGDRDQGWRRGPNTHLTSLCTLSVICCEIRIKPSGCSQVLQHPRVLPPPTFYLVPMPQAEKVCCPHSALLAFPGPSTESGSFWYGRCLGTVTTRGEGSYARPDLIRAKRSCFCPPAVFLEGSDTGPGCPDMRSAYTDSKCTVWPAKNAGPWLQPHVRRKKGSGADLDSCHRGSDRLWGQRLQNLPFLTAHQSSEIVRAGPAFCPPRGTRAL